MITPASPGSGDITIPGDPGALRQAATVYAKAAGGMAQSAGQLRSSPGLVSAWHGLGAAAHAERAQALAAAHEVASDALNYGSQALTTYAADLEQARALARQANAANAAAAHTGAQLVSVLDRESTASTTPSDPYVFAKTGNIGESPAAADAQQATRLSQTLSAQQTQASKLGGEALSLAQRATAQAAATFSAIAEMAGNAALHGSGDPYSSYLGVDRPGEAAALIQAAYNLGGIPAGSDTSALGDLAADPMASGLDRTLAAKYAATNANDARTIDKEIALVRSKGVKDLPAGWATMSPEERQGILLADLSFLKAHPEPSAWEIIGLHVAALGLGFGAAGLTFLSFLQAGADPASDSADAADIGATASVEGEASAESQLASRIRSLNGGAALLLLGSTGADVGQGVLTGHFDVPQLALDGVSLVPGVGAVFADGRVLTTVECIDSLKSDLTAGADATTTAAAIRSLEQSGLTQETLAKFLAAKSLSAGLGGWVYSAATLGLAPTG